MPRIHFDSMIQFSKFDAAVSAEQELTKVVSNDGIFDFETHWLYTR